MRIFQCVLLILIWNILNYSLSVIENPWSSGLSAGFEGVCCHASFGLILCSWRWHWIFYLPTFTFQNYHQLLPYPSDSTQSACNYCKSTCKTHHSYSEQQRWESDLRLEWISHSRRAPGFTLPCCLSVRMNMEEALSAREREAGHNIDGDLTYRLFLNTKDHVLCLQNS